MEAFKKEPALIIGVVVAVITSIIAGVNDGGWQWDPDGWVVLSQLATALGIRQVVFSPASAEKLRVERT
jgi:predicted pyridoxine 5'-phosphate oxidase superfamily flavin-nucleotide-binding protein